MTFKLPIPITEIVSLALKGVEYEISKKRTEFPQKNIEDFISEVTPLIEKRNLLKKTLEDFGIE